ncbi:MAG: RNA methyltransferase [Planctomycetales bacterium]|nr:RNA methyltransferase [Planctomycetales bacterium]
MIRSADNIRIVLVQPESPGNVGAVARALKTMGLSELVLVAPICDPRSDHAVALAHNATNVLAAARIVPTLEQALSDTTFSVATTNRIRCQNAPFLTPRQLAPDLLAKSVSHPAAIVFGRESSGLTNAEASLCSIQSTVPAATDVPSLNLAQAVMIYVYELFQASLVHDEETYPWQLASHSEFEQFYAHLGQTLEQLGTRPATTMDNYIARFRRVLSRVPLESRDIRLLHSLLATVNRQAEPAPGIRNSGGSRSAANSG